MEDVRYIICNLFRGLKKKSNLQLLLENILIKKTLCADIFKAPMANIIRRFKAQKKMWLTFLSANLKRKRYHLWSKTPRKSVRLMDF